MYNPLSSCSAFVHLLLKHPILIVGLGLTSAVGFLSPQIENGTIEEVQQKEVFKAKIQQLKEDPASFQLTEKAGPTFEAIIEEVGLLPKEQFTFIVAEEPEEVVNVPPSSKEEKWFLAIKRVESGDRPIGVHPDGVSYGPAGLTLIALKDVISKLPSCRDMGFDEILDDPEWSVKFAYLYFLDQIHRFKDMDTATIAYNVGPTRVAKLKRAGKDLPQTYLNKVKVMLGEDKH